MALDRSTQGIKYIRPYPLCDFSTLGDGHHDLVRKTNAHDVGGCTRH